MVGILWDENRPLMQRQKSSFNSNTNLLFVEKDSGVALRLARTGASDDPCHTSRGRGQGTPLCHPSTETRPLPRCRELLSRIPWGLLGVYSLTYLFRGLITVNEREILYSLSPLRMITGKIRCRLTLPHIFETNGREFVGNFLRKWPIAFVFIAARSDSALLTHVMFFTFVCWCYYFLNSYPTQKR